MLCQCRHCTDRLTNELSTIRGERGPRALLSPTEKSNLTIFKWRYTAETQGFDRQEAETLVFTRWRLRAEIVQRQQRSTIW